MRGIRRGVFGSLLLRGRIAWKGTSSAAELLYLNRAASRVNARLIAEIGFNTGLSSRAFLTAHPDVRVVSFDLGQPWVETAKTLIDKQFPGRHTLICGDSRITVPEYKASHPSAKFDLVFIDGGHGYEIAKADLLNMRELSTDKTAVIVDDLVPWFTYGAGPAKAWNDAIAEGVLRQTELVKDGKRVDVIEPPGRRIWGLGQYVF
jgi:predicted O-methyltransferase YrrM